MEFDLRVRSKCRPLGILVWPVRQKNLRRMKKFQVQQAINDRQKDIFLATKRYDPEKLKHYLRTILKVNFASVGHFDL